MNKKWVKKFNKFNMRNHPAEYFIFAIILVGVHLLAGLLQERILVNDGRGWDGVVYHSMAVQALNNEPFSQRSPFVYRQLLPYLAAKFVSVPSASATAQQEVATQITSIFGNINLLAATLTAFLILIFLRGFIADARLRLCVAALYPLHYLGHLRKTYWLPIDTDAIMALAIVGGLLVMQNIRKKPTINNVLILTLICFVAALNRNSAILIPLAALFLLPVSAHPSYIAKIISYARNFKFILLLPFAGFIAAFLLVRHNAEVTGSYGGEIAKYKAGFLIFVVDHIYKKSFVKMIYSIFIGAGPMLVLLLWQYKIVWEFLKKNWHFLALLIIVFSYGVYESHHRFIVTIMPVYAVLLGLVIQERKAELWNKKTLMVILIIAQLISQRVFWLTPIDMPLHPSFVPLDWPVVFPVLFTPWTSDFLYYNITVNFAANDFLGIWAVSQYIIFSVIMLFLLNAPSFSQIKQWCNDKKL